MARRSPCFSAALQLDWPPGITQNTDISCFQPAAAEKVSVSSISPVQSVGQVETEESEKAHMKGCRIITHGYYGKRMCPACRSDVTCLSFGRGEREKGAHGPVHDIAHDPTRRSREDDMSSLTQRRIYIQSVETEASVIDACIDRRPPATHSDHVTATCVPTR